MMIKPPRNPRYQSSTHTADDKPLVLMSSYDRRRRLPPAPYLPNHIADPLLNQPNRRP